MEFDILTRIDIHIFSILICLVIFVDIWRQGFYYRQYSSGLYLLLLGLCCVNTLLEAISWLLRGQVTQQFNFVFNTFYFMLTPLPQLFWSLYVEHQFDGKKGCFNTRFSLLVLPVVLAEIMLFINCFSPFIFDVDSGGHYFRLWGYPLFAVFCYALFAYTLIRVFAGRKRIGPNLFRPLLFFHLPPLSGGILQCFLYGTSFIWPGTALALLIGYLNIQNKRLVTDYLTGAYNRLEMDRYLNRKISNAKPFWGILIDLDSFKDINDTYGHVVGDEILIKTVTLLQNSISLRDFLARYGGDEFLIIVNAKTEDTVISTMKRIEEQVAAFNEDSRYAFQLSLSLGYGLYDAKQALSVTEFLSHIDSKMYHTKHSKSK